jgi:hypothetical protein
MEEDGFFDFSVLMHCAVYALLRKGTVVYIGQSRSVGERLQTHCRKRKGGAKKVGFTKKIPVGFAFDAIWVRPCMMGELDELERMMIRKYEPKYNQRHMPAKPPIALDMLIDMMPMVSTMPPPPPMVRPNASWRRL